MTIDDLKAPDVRTPASMRLREHCVAIDPFKEEIRVLGPGRHRGFVFLDWRLPCLDDESAEEIRELCALRRAGEALLDRWAELNNRLFRLDHWFEPFPEECADELERRRRGGIPISEVSRQILTVCPMRAGILFKESDLALADRRGMLCNEIATTVAEEKQCTTATDTSATPRWSIFRRRSTR